MNKESFYVNTVAGGTKVNCYLDCTISDLVNLAEVYGIVRIIVGIEEGKMSFIATTDSIHYLLTLALSQIGIDTVAGTEAILVYDAVAKTIDLSLDPVLDNFNIKLQSKVKEFIANGTDVKAGLTLLIDLLSGSDINTSYMKASLS